MLSQGRSVAVCAFIGLLILCLPILFSNNQLQGKQRANPRDIFQRDLSSREQLDDPAIEVVNGTGQDGSNLQPATHWSIFSSSHSTSNPHALERRADGPLYCTNGPCIDGSCCGKNGICGYGPDFCGDGCTSQCNATAMCGQYSENGEMPCGMKLCCSATGWCGTTEVYCGNADPLHGTLPCQAGYGSCAITGPPSCASGSGSSSKRKIGYYQSWNQRDRKCNKVAPSQLNTKGYTHLFFSFASIDPQSFRITPAHPDDVQGMKDFTALSKGGNLQTWIAVGGFDFSNPEAATHTTWSDMVSTKANRAAFISSVKEYMDTYGFQGVDLDWEYPGAPERGGKKLADTRNLSLLVKEMRAAYGIAYGISLTLAPDYWYLRWFDAKAMERNVDFFGFMAYDLHGSWDADVKTLGSLVRGQADIREISKNTLPLWFDGLDPAKLNFGLAMYGRGYTLADPSCNQLLCPFSGPSKPAPCTSFGGVMSLVEIKNLIKEKGLTPQYLEESMMKQITWDDQWIGYDDEETFAAKLAYADSLCFGGSMVWSIDFQEIGSGGPDGEEQDYGEVVYVGTEVYQQPTAQCSPPCVMVFPPSTLDSPTAVTLPPYTATLEVGTTTTTIVAVPTAQTVTVTVIDFFNYYITTSQQPGEPITLRPSFEAPPATVVVTGQNGEPTSRTVLPPPLGGPSSQIPGGTNPGDNPGGDGGDEIPFPFEPTPDPIDDDMEPVDVSDITTVPADPDSTDTAVPFPWPTGAVKPVTNPDDPVEEGSSRVSCKSWFFFICIAWIDLNINVQSWDIKLPPGTIGPGPPPVELLNLPSGWRVGCCLPPWPKMTILPNGQIASTPPEPEACEPTTATLTIESTSYGTTTTQGTVRTTATKTLSREFPIVGCVEDNTIATTVTACDRPTARAVAPAAGVPAKATGVSAASDLLVGGAAEGRDLTPRAGCDPPVLVDAVIFLENPTSSANPLRRKLTTDSASSAPGGPKLASFKVIEAPSAGVVAFFYLEKVQKNYLEESGGLKLRNFFLIGSIVIITPTTPPSSWTPSRSADQESIDQGPSNETALLPSEHGLWKRTEDFLKGWAPSQISVPPRKIWLKTENYDKIDKTYRYQRDSSECEGQFVYVIEDGIDDNHPTLALINGANRIEKLDGQVYGNWRPYTRETMLHGTKVASMIAGDQNGVCPQGKVTIVKMVVAGGTQNRWDEKKNKWAAMFQKLESLALAVEDISGKKRGNKSVVNMSWNVSPMPEAEEYEDVMRALLQALDKLNVVLVAASGNQPNTDITVQPQMFANGLPQKFVNDGVPNLINVGASDINGRAGLFTRQGAGLTVWAPGHLVHAAKADYSNGELETAAGTSYAAPMVAGLVAYYRALPGYGDGLDDPQVVKLLVRKMRRGIQAGVKKQDKGAYIDKNGRKFGALVPPIWNGQLSKDVSCLRQPNAPGCPSIDLGNPTPVGDLCTGAFTKRDVIEGPQETNETLIIRQEDSCPFEPGDGSGSGQGPTKTITYNSGAPSPTCTSGCGKLCTDFWCRPGQTGQPPFFTDPANQSSGLPNLPTLPPTGVTSCPAGSAATSAVQCAGNNGHSACITRQVCTEIPQTTAKPTPTSTPKDPGMTCYRDNNASGKWQPFKSTDANALYFPTCNSGLKLTTNGQGFIGNKNGLRMSFKWADDQTGCKGKKDFDLYQPCHTGFSSIGGQCDVGHGEDNNYGGTYRMQTDYGCVQVSMGKSDLG
ncbi:hypothetical protein JX266_001162 [Neoarthrinium moseri]|nr:hypothetical protein JX266_001162 [Neoarthrinium moseri]